MNERVSSATEETGATPIEAPDGSQSETKKSPRSFLDSARRNLSEEELSTPAGQRFLLSEIERLDEECAEARAIIQKYHDLRVEKAVLDERLRSQRWHEILSGLCLAAGSAGIGASSRFLSIDGAVEAGYMLLSVSALLVVAGIASKVWK